MKLSIQKKIIFAISVPALVIALLPAAGITLALDPSVFTVKLKGFSEKIYDGEKSVYLLTSRDENFSLPNTPFQQVLEKVKGVGSVRLKILSADTHRLEAPHLIRDIDNTRLLGMDRPEIRSLAKKFSYSPNAVGEVESFVYRYITDKKYGLPLLPAPEVARSRTGDCKAHTVLSIALLRSLRVPARALTGMVLCPEFEGMKNVFVFHMWAEALIGGRWVLVDATRPGPKHPGLYVAFAYHNLKTEMPLAYLKAMSAMKELQVEYGGKP